MDESGTEVAYSLSLQDDHVKTESRSVYLRENSFAPGQYTQIVLEVGKQASFHNAVHMQTPESDFIDWVEVAASDDAHLWRIVNPRAPISRFRRENLAGNQTVRYSQNNARYLRLRIFEPSRQFPVTSASISFNSELAEPSRDLLPALLAAIHLRLLPCLAGTPISVPRYSLSPKWPLKPASPRSTGLSACSPVKTAKSGRFEQAARSIDTR